MTTDGEVLSSHKKEGTARQNANRPAPYRFERRADLRAYNRRRLDYVTRGGTVVVQYNKMEFNQADYGPYPAKVSGNRVADELAPVKVLAPADPVFNVPNRIGPPTWTGWVQERGLYFSGFGAVPSVFGAARP